MQAASYLVVIIIILFAPAYGGFLRTSIYNTTDRDLLPLVERLRYVQADTGRTDIHGNALDNPIVIMGIETFNRIREVKTFVFPFVTFHLKGLLSIDIWFFYYKNRLNTIGKNTYFY